METICCEKNTKIDSEINSEYSYEKTSINQCLISNMFNAKGTSFESTRFVECLMLMLIHDNYVIRHATYSLELIS